MSVTDVGNTGSITYQGMLRALGAYLDQEASCRITLVEMPDGFVVRMQRHLHKVEPVAWHIRHEDLQDRLRKLMTDHSKRPHNIRHQGIWARFPNGHQDFFRALGFELDDAGARQVLIDELEDGLLVTYKYRDQASDEVWRKRTIKLGESEIEAVLNAAFERRGKIVL